MGLRRNDETVQNRPVMLTSASTRIIDRINDGGSIVNMASLAGVNWPQAVADISRFIEDADFGASWKLSTDGLPEETIVRVISEDHERQGFLFLGTEWKTATL